MPPWRWSPCSACSPCRQQATATAPTSTKMAAEVAGLEKVPPVPPGAPIEQPGAAPRCDPRRRRLGEPVSRPTSPGAMRWGLYQGSSVGKAARDAYVRELDGQLLPRLAARVKQRLAEYASDPEKLYVYLKAYLMLGEPKRLDKTYLQFLADLEWHPAGGRPPPRATPCPSTSAACSNSGTRCARSPSIASTIAQDAQRRSSRRRFPGSIYARIKRNYEGDTARALRLDVAAGAGVERVLKRRSGASLPQPLPSLYGRNVFKEVTRAGHGRADQGVRRGRLGVGHRRAVRRQRRQARDRRDPASTRSTTSPRGTRCSTTSRWCRSRPCSRRSRRSASWRGRPRPCAAC